MWALNPDRGVDGWCVRCDDGLVRLSQFCSLMDNDDSSLKPYNHVSKNETSDRKEPVAISNTYVKSSRLHVAYMADRQLA